MRLASLLSKIDSIESYCTSQASSQCSNVGGTDYSQDTIAAYRTALDKLRTAVNNYYNADKAERTRLLNMIINTMYQTKVMGFMVPDDESLSFHELDTHFAPRGYNDFTQLFDMGQAGDDLLNMPESAFFAGCVTQPTVDVTSTLVTIYTHIDAVNRQEIVDAEDRAALVAWLQETNMKNSSIILFEEASVTDNRGSHYKQDLGNDIFIERKAAEIINFYDLPIRLPSYINV